MLKNFKVVNDSAECGVALIKKFNRILTNDEEQKQYLLQIVADHRKQFPNACKKTLFKQMYNFAFNLSIPRDG